jgi:hypothetical protein
LTSYPAVVVVGFLMAFVAGAFFAAFSAVAFLAICLPELSLQVPSSKFPPPSFVHPPTESPV